MEETTKPTIKCSYCDAESFYFYHKNKVNEIDWAICFGCLKKFCDKVLGEGKNGGRVD
jgi:hypothetical protein